MANETELFQQIQQRGFPLSSFKKEKGYIYILLFHQVTVVCSSSGICLRSLAFQTTSISKFFTKFELLAQLWHHNAIILFVHTFIKNT